MLTPDRLWVTLAYAKVTYSRSGVRVILTWYTGVCAILTVSIVLVFIWLTRIFYWHRLSVEMLCSRACMYATCVRACLRECVCVHVFALWWVSCVCVVSVHVRARAWVSVFARKLMLEGLCNICYLIAVTCQSGFLVQIVNKCMNVSTLMIFLFPWTIVRMMVRFRAMVNRTSIIRYAWTAE